MENELVMVSVNENNEPVIDGRELHKFLQVNSNYTTWFKRMCEYGFSEDVDFFPKMEESIGGRPAVNHVLTLDMAKEIAMVQRNERGKLARQHFIEIEKKWNSPEKVMARALIMANNNIIELKDTIQLLEPKAKFADAVSGSPTSIPVGDLAKMMKQNGIDIGQNKLFAWLRKNGWLMNTKDSWNMPTQRGMNMKLFEIKEMSCNDQLGYARLYKKPVVTGKGQIYFLNKMLEINVA